MKMRKLLFVLCFFLIAAIPRIVSLSAHWSSDEAGWLNRSEVFISDIQQGKFSEVHVAHAPGVMTMWIAGLRTFLTEPRVDVRNLALARWFIGIVISVGVSAAGLLLYRLFGGWVSLISIVGIAFSPLFLAQTRRVHTDALATTFILLTVLLFLAYCQNRQHPYYLLLSGVAFGLAVLSKSYALILLLWIPLCVFLFRNREKQADRFLIHSTDSLYFFNCAAITIIAIWPVFWTPPFGILGVCLFGAVYLLDKEIKNKKITLTSVSFWASIIVLGITCIRMLQTIQPVFDRISWAVTTPHEIAHFFLGKIMNDPGWLFYLFVLTIKSTPLMLPLAIAGVFILWKQRRCSLEIAGRLRLTLALVISIILFMICLSATSKKFPRYLLPVFPILDILSALGFVELLRWGCAQIHLLLRNRGTTALKTAFIAVTCLSFFFIQVLPVLALHPYYGTYYNPCWRMTDITKIITVGDASGLDLAAKYLNKKEDATQMHIQGSLLANEFLGYYFLGKTHYAKPLINSPTIKYEVVYIRDSQIGWSPQKGIYGGELEKVITLNGIDLVWIYRVQSEENL